jgi:hypothetical protein
MMKGIVLTGTLVFLASVSLAANRLYSGSATSGDLASPANWSGSRLPDPLTDRAFFTSQDQNGNNSVLPSTGLTLSENLMLGAIEFNYRNTVPFDLNGKTLSFPDDNSYTVNINNHVKMTMGNGVVTNLSRLALNIGTELNLTNMTVYLRNPYVSQRYNSTLRVLKDAAVVFTTLPSGDLRFVTAENDATNTNPKTFIIDGGRVEARSSMPQWRRLVIGGRTNCLWHICNGGRFDDYSSAPNLFLRSSGSSLLISSGGELTQTNAVTTQSQYNEHIGLVLGGDIANGFVGVSNATLRTSRFNYLAKTENRCVFKDAMVDLRYHGPDGAYASTTNASGLFFRAGSSKGEVLVTGEDGHFTADQVTFEKGSSDHSFSADGGNLTVGLIADSGEGNRLSFSGCTLNGGVQLKGQGGVVTFGDGAVCRMPTQDKGLQFANDVAQGSRLVVSNAQIECGGAFCGSCPTGGGSSIWACTASVYTNCPGSAIEFRGTSPCLKITSSWTRPTSGSGYWFCAAFGTFSEGVLGTSPLGHPLTLRFVLPETPYQQAPLQGDAPTSSGGRPVVLAGNARIEVLPGDFRPTRTVYRMPLISDVNNFTQSKDADHVFFGLDIEALNRNNAETLPLGSRLVYVKEGQVGRIDIVFPRGFALVLR